MSSVILMECNVQRHEWGGFFWVQSAGGNAGFEGVVREEMLGFKGCEGGNAGFEGVVREEMMGLKGL